MVFNWHGEINKDRFDKLIESYNRLKAKEKIVVYLNSPGGDVDIMQAFISLVNANIPRFKVVAYGQIYSAAFFIFYLVHCEKELLPGTTGMCHLIRISIEVSERKVPYYREDVANKEWVGLQRQWTRKFCEELGMNRVELADINKGEEVYFQYDRLVEFLNNR